MYHKLYDMGRDRLIEKEEQKRLLEEMMRKDQKDGIYDYYEGENNQEVKYCYSENSDPIVESVVSKFRSRSQAGIKKYGVTLEREDLTAKEWLIHLQEELMDAVNYIEVNLNKL